MHILSNRKCNILKKLLNTIFIILVFSNCTLIARNDIRNYKVYFAVGDFKSKAILIIRKFENTGKQFYMGVNPNSLETQIIPSEEVSIHPLSWQQILIDYKNSTYIKAILAAKSQSFSIQNSGITHGFPKENGVTLTIDLCPSHKPLKRIILTSLITEFKRAERPVPVAISITGKFMQTHSKDLIWLKRLVDSGKITVTWINHTYNHHYNPKAPLTENFLLEPNTDLNFEILETEIALLNHGLQPSVFFRFPGLVSNPSIVDKVLEYGLIPIGTDAWLAKGQPIHAGSIVLIHGNGNEPIGIRDFIKLLQTEKVSVMKKKWLLYDLRESIQDEFH